MTTENQAGNPETEHSPSEKTKAAPKVKKNV